MQLVANILAFIASLFMVYSGILKDKKRIIKVQAIEIFIFIVSDILVAGYSGAVINLINLIRNILVYYDKFDKKCIVLILVLSTISVLAFNNLGFIGLLPLFATYIYAIFMNTKDIKCFKIVMIISMLLWATYDMTIGLYTSLAFDILTIISCLVTLLMLDKKRI